MLQSMIESWNDPSSRHAMLVHFPVVLALLGVALTALFALTKFRSRGLLAACAACFALALATSFASAQSGKSAEDRVEHVSPALASAEDAAFERHEEAGESLYLWTIPALAFTLLAAAPRAAVRTIGGSLAVAASIALAAQTAATAHLGGELVYTWGLGVPARGEKIASLPATEQRAVQREHEDDDDD